MNLPVGSISVISPPTGSQLPIGTVGSSIFPHLAFCLCRSLCRRAPEREAAISAFAVLAYNCLASVRGRRVCWYRQWLKLESASGYHRLCVDDINCASAVAYVAVLKAVAVCRNHHAS